MKDRNAEEESSHSHGDVSMGRGRGVLRLAPGMQSTPVSPGVFGSNLAGIKGTRLKRPNDLVSQPLRFSPGMSPVVPSFSNALTTDGEVASSQLADLIRSIGSEIGESIKTSLMQKKLCQSLHLSRLQIIVRTRLSHFKVALLLLMHQNLILC
ncbi:hypothetical protein XENOCAPTIV_025510 [Xenoophorus captivus]|uniref:Uncharacterized protein n=1 Tax=Xenoophorus captivus TaxID=1517983 RepID=A0ABV0QL45_9TELE